MSNPVTITTIESENKVTGTTDIGLHIEDNFLSDNLMHIKDLDAIKDDEGILNALNDTSEIAAEIIQWCITNADHVTINGQTYDARQIEKMLI